MPTVFASGALVGGPATARPWLDRWLAANADLADLHASNPQVDAVIDEIDGRRVRIGGRWLIDFASCNYLGLDLDREIIEAIPAYLDRWGTHPSWSRMIGSPVLYEQLERELVELLGAEDVLLLQTLTHIHASVIPVLAGDGAIFIDARAHKTIYDGCVVARAHGATMQRFRHDDPDDLERLLASERRHPRLICMDGINSMTGNPPDLAAFSELARRYEALLYVDDGHGFAFVGCPPQMKELLKIAAPPYLYSGPSPVASLATGLEGLKVNAERGDALRAGLYAKTRRVLDHLEFLGVMTLNTSGFPIVEVPMADPDDLGKVGAVMYERGIYVTLAFYPGVPREEVGFRLQITAANTDEQVSELIDVLDELASAGRLRLRE